MNMLLIMLFIIATNIVTGIVTSMATKEKARAQYYAKKKADRIKRWKEEECGEVGLNASEIVAKRINESLPFTKNLDIIGSQKEFKLASLVIEDKNGHATVEDYYLLDSEGEVKTLSDFRKDDRNVDWMLNDFNVLESITANIDHEIVDNVERYSDFYETVNNCYGGRHGKDKIDIKESFVVFTDLTKSELEIIANHTDEMIHKKAFSNAIDKIKNKRSKDFEDYQVELDNNLKVLESKFNKLDILHEMNEIMLSTINRSLLGGCL